MGQELVKPGDDPSAATLLQAAQAAANGRAYQSIAQSIAISVQDAVDNLRNIETISTTATGVAMAQFLATKDPAYAEVIAQAQTVMATAITNFQAVGKAAAQIVQEFNKANS